MQHRISSRLAGSKSSYCSSVSSVLICHLCSIFHSMCKIMYKRDAFLMLQWTAHGINHVSLDVLKKLLWGCQARAKATGKGLDTQVCFNHQSWWKASTRSPTGFSSCRQSWRISEPIVYYKLSRCEEENIKVAQQTMKIRSRQKGTIKKAGEETAMQQDQRRVEGKEHQQWLQMEKKLEFKIYGDGKALQHAWHSALSWPIPSFLTLDTTALALSITALAQLLFSMGQVRDELRWDN